MQEATLTPTPAMAPFVASARLMSIARAGWVGLALYLLVVFAVGTVLRHGDMLQPCEATREVCGLAGRLRPVNLQGLNSPEDALQFHAIFYTIEQTAVRLLLWAFALFIFVRQRNDRMALLVSFWLLTIAPPFAEYAAAQRWLWLVAPIQGTRIISGICFTLFLFLFPNGRFVPGWTRWLALVFIA